MNNNPKEIFASIKNFLITGSLNSLIVGATSKDVVLEILGKPTDLNDESAGEIGHDCLTYDFFEFYFSNSRGEVSAMLQTIKVEPPLIDCDDVATSSAQGNCNSISCGERVVIDGSGYSYEMTVQQFGDRATIDGVSLSWWRTKGSPDEVLYAKTSGGVYVQFVGSMRSGPPGLLTMHRTLDDAWWSNLFPLDV